jgi:hypothetical protein
MLVLQYSNNKITRLLVEQYSYKSIRQLRLEQKRSLNI